MHARGTFGTQTQPGLLFGKWVRIGRPPSTRLFLSKGHPIGARGIAQIVEICEQLRGAAGERQVTGAKVGMTENGGGLLGRDAAAMSVHVFSV